MELRARDGTRLILTILRYEFPDLATVEYDSNWLMIHIDVETPQGVWAATDPSLLTYEARELAEWLGAVAANKPADPEISFLEPNLRFEVREEPEGTRTLWVYFNAECRPPWAKEQFDEDECYADFPLAELDLRRAARDLRAQLERYPQRTEH